MKRITLLILACITPLLAGCGSAEPTEEEMRAAIEGQLDSGMRILSFQKEACNMQDEGRYLCSYMVEMELQARDPDNPFRTLVKVDRRTMDDLFYKDGGNWTIDVATSAG